jgi:hypothetical protein
MLFFARVIESVDRADAGSWQIADGGGHAEREGSSTRATILRDPLSSMSAILDIVESDSLSLLKTRVLSSRRGPRAPADPPEKLNSECNYTV